ncbi:glycosyltransferase family 39 protein [Candidatus Collierbacteria bacterium]|nr:glycosyltransferase family 39 protein [Candidatus Collierbacteria bacterium]
MHKFFKSSPSDKFWLLIILIVGFWIRLVGLSQSLWLDEAIEWWAVTSFSLKQLLFGYMAGDFNPPAHHLLLWFWVKVFGDSEISLRFPSVLFGIGIVYLTYKISKLILGKKDDFIGVSGLSLRASHVSAIFAAFSGLLIYYSQEARMYSMAAFFTACAFYFLIKNESLKNKLGISYILFTMLFAVGLYSHYLVWLLLPLLLITGKKYILPLVAVIPWIPMLFKQLASGLSAAGNPVWAQLSQTSVKNLLLVAIKFVTGRIPFPDSEGLLILTVILGAAFWFLAISGIKELSEKQESKRVLMILLGWIIWPTGLGAVIGIFIPVFSYFRLLFILPPVLILAAAGTIRQRWLLEPMVLGLMISSAVYVSGDTYRRENWAGAVADVEKREPGAMVVIHPAVRPPFDYYNRGRSSVIDVSSLHPSSIIYYPSLWYIPYAQPIFDADDSTRQLLESRNFNRTYQQHFRGVTVEHWVKDNE